MIFEHSLTELSKIGTKARILLPSTNAHTESLYNLTKGVGRKFSGGGGQQKKHYLNLFQGGRGATERKTKK